jgi:hypothetical protein
MKQRTVQKEKRLVVRIDGLEDFPLETVGLTVDSIERADGHVKIPIELIPFIKICRMPVVTRRKKAKDQRNYLLRVRKRKHNHSRKRRSNR